MTREFEIEIVGRGEEVLYSDGEIELALERTYISGHRLFCDSIGGARSDLLLPILKRRQIIENLCDFFDTKKKPCIFVLDEEDKDRPALEELFADLITGGHKLSVEFDSEGKRERAKDDEYLSIIKAGKKLSIHGVEINSVEEYWKWKTES